VANDNSRLHPQQASPEVLAGAARSCGARVSDVTAPEADGEAERRFQTATGAQAAVPEFVQPHPDACWPLGCVSIPAPGT
jgi:hypothetical protein